MNEDLKKVLARVALSLDNESTPADLLAIKCASALKSYPGDKTLGTMNVILEKMAANNKSVSRKELTDLYNKTYSKDTKFAIAFAKELGLSTVQEAPVKLAEKTPSHIVETEYRDEVLVNALKNAWDSSLNLPGYASKTAKTVIAAVSSTLDGWNAKPASLSVDAGNEHFLVLRADYETPKGKVGFYIPVETAGNKYCQANYFVANDGHHDLNYKEIKNYLVQNAGSRVKFAGSEVLNMLEFVTSKKRDISSTEIALIKLNAAKQAGDPFAATQVYGQTLDKVAKKDIEIKKSAEFEGVSEHFGSALGQASFKFGDKLVNTAREVVARELHGFGHKGSQVAVSKVDRDTIYFGVCLPTKIAFTVPVKVENGKLKSPSVLLSKGSVASFSAKGINGLTESDDLVGTSFSVHADLNSSELLGTIKTALATDNIEKAEDALHVLGMKDKASYLVGLGYFSKGLAKKASGPVCDKQQMTKNSQYPICGHTGLPLHKTCKDKHGHCRPAYRDGKDEGYEGGFFSTAKILG